MANYVPISGDYNNPVILASGILGIGDSSKTKMYYNKYISNITIRERNGGRMKIQIHTKDGRKPNISACLITQAESDSITDSTVSKWGRSVGAHYFSVNFWNNSDTITIHETHSEDQNNDTWDSTVIDESVISSISIIIFGYLTE